MCRNAAWWTEDFDLNFERARVALRRDWEQTLQHLGLKDGETLNQDAGNTVRQVVGREPIPYGPNFEDNEEAFRFGHGAWQFYHDHHPHWDERLEHKLRQDWGGDYDRYRGYIRFGYEGRGSRLSTG